MIITIALVTQNNVTVHLRQGWAKVGLQFVWKKDMQVMISTIALLTQNNGTVHLGTIL